MTKEQLKQEAEEYTEKKHCEKCGTKHCEKKCVLVKDDYETFLDVAEPREKRIAELEQKVIDINETWKDNIKGVDEERFRLEKENAELKEYNKYLKRKRQGGIQKQYNKVAIIKQQNDQLTKATEIIKKLYDKTFRGIGFMELNDYNTLKAEAEQFLKDSEVEK